MVLGSGDLRAQGGGGIDGVLVVQLGVQAAEGGAGIDQGLSLAAVVPEGAPAAQSDPDGGPVPAGQVAESRVPEHMALVLGVDQGTACQRLEHEETIFSRER